MDGFRDGSGACSPILCTAGALAPGPALASGFLSWPISPLHFHSMTTLPPLNNWAPAFPMRSSGCSHFDGGTNQVITSTFSVKKRFWVILMTETSSLIFSFSNTFTKLPCEHMHCSYLSHTSRELSPVLLCFLSQSGFPSQPQSQLLELHQKQRKRKENNGLLLLSETSV